MRSTIAASPPTGLEIVGTADLVECNALSQGSEAGQPEYLGETDIVCDTQKTKTLAGKMLFVDADGEEWTFDELVRVDHADDWDRREALALAR